MCKYCRMESTSIAGEYINENGRTPLITVKDGSQLMYLYLNRYKTDCSQDNNLEMEFAVRLKDDCEYGVKNKTMKIKYCPFCGEEL